MSSTPVPVTIDLLNLKDPANRDRVAHIESLLRQILYSGEIGAELPHTGHLWTLAPGSAVSMISQAEDESVSHFARRVPRHPLGVGLDPVAGEVRVGESESEPEPPEAA